eukprot:TRINITY_DN1207_c0_g1_i1.p1 TRINITY_DN1207_c0_g1~~TRINITY_DN1207_c0_g1_i1.p1  ORF type:complete len:547 (+),score=140.99 TRINITY_DN1207_c0_g1_i1:27-1643(+)
MRHYLSLFFILSLSCLSHAVYYTGVLRSDNSIQILLGKQSNALCIAEWNDELKVRGWGKLNIQTFGSQNSFSDSLQMKCAGLLEGYSTASQISLWFQSWRNNEYKGKNLTLPLQQFMRDQYTFSKALPGVPEPLKSHTLLIMDQFEGLYEGYTRATKMDSSLVEIEHLQLYSLISDGDLETLNDIFEPNNLGTMMRREYREKREEKNDDVELPPMMDCSGFVKVNQGELYTGHTTWTRYYSMYRILKSYHFDLKANRVASKKVSFSSRPGFLASKDDFYQMDNGLVSWETTNSIIDTKLLKLVVPQTLFSWQRAILANRLARNGKEWTLIFSSFNSGTYNNQWVVTDYNKFKPGSAVTKDTLWIVEQIPGKTFSKDVSDVLRNQSYWPSFNVPYLAETYVASGYGSCSSDGKCDDYVKDTRNILFSTLQGGANSFTNFKRVLQHNNYLHDPVSKGHPAIAISSRYDLEPQRKAAFGGIDSKTVSYQSMKKFSFDAISGPSHQSIEPFDWSKGDWKEWHEGQPTKWNFDWQTFQPKPLA